MSTRLRVTLHCPNGGTSKGSRAVKELLILTHPQAGAVALSKVLTKLGAMPKAAKLRAIAEKLPVGWTFTMIQEPRGTRKNRSLYWQAMQQNRGNLQQGGENPYGD